MVSTSLARQQVKTALRMVEEEAASATEKAEMLMEIAMGLQRKPDSPQALHDAVGLYQRALDLLPDSETLLAARIRARMGTALQAVPAGDSEYLHRAQAAFEAALPVLEEQGSAEEQAEAWMNLGLVIQSLAGIHQAKITDAISAYQKALRVFDAQAHPAEYAILHNNLATAFLSIPMTDARAKMREALAVQSFEAALKVVNIVDHPSEYAMLQNNLGNALQYASSAHMVENNLRALEAYDEALRVRNPTDTPLEYANTIANKANALWNLPDDPARPEAGNRVNLHQAAALFREAEEIFTRFGETAKAEQIAAALAELQQELDALPGNGQDRPAQTSTDRPEEDATP